MMFAPVYITLAPLQYSQSGVSLYPKTHFHLHPNSARSSPVTDRHRPSHREPVFVTILCSANRTPLSSP